MSMELKAGLIGYPVEHSLSPIIHSVFLSGFSLSGEYNLFSTPSDELHSRIESLERLGYSGVNITVPHKIAALSLCDEISPRAERAAAVNTLVFTERTVRGENTDVAGFTAMAKNLPEPFVILGRGGASAAAVTALQGRDFRVAGRGDSNAHLGDTATGTVVNATPLGWRDEDSFPLKIPQGWTFADLNYNPRWIWRNSLKSRGIKVVTGEVMLVEQAACSFALWTGYTPDEAMKKKALERIKAEAYD